MRRTTPQQSWDATAIAEAPRPKPIPLLPEPQGPGPVFPLVGAGVAAPDPAGYDVVLAEGTSMYQKPDARPEAAQREITGSQKLRAYPDGVVKIGRTMLSLANAMGGRIVIVDCNAKGIVFPSTEGEIIAEYLRSPGSTSYVGIRKARARFHK